MALVLDFLARARGQGPLALGSRGRARLEAVAPVFRQVSAETRAHPRGPIPAAFMLAIAWGESSFSPTAVGPEIPGRSDRALGLMQVLDSHDGRRVQYGGPGDVLTISARDLRDPLHNVRAAAGLLFSDFAYGSNVVETLRKYGGFDRADPSEYIGNVESRFAWLTAETLAGRI